MNNVIEFDFANTELCWCCRKRKATKLCDFPLPPRRTTIDFKTYRLTCDRAICDKCATNIGHELDFCPVCMKKVKGDIK